MYILKQLWCDESGSADYLFLIMLLTICVLGVLPGIATMRDQVVQQFGDLAVAFESLDQTYSINVNGVVSLYEDEPTTLEDPDGSEPACISVINGDATPESP